MSVGEVSEKKIESKRAKATPSKRESEIARERARARESERERASERKGVSAWISTTKKRILWKRTRPRAVAGESI